MPRIRTIKPDFFIDDKLGDLPMAARLLFVGLWCLADSEGRLENNPKKIKVQTLPYDDVDISELLAGLHKAGLILCYSVDNKGYIEIINFRKHQRLSGKEATQISEFPAPVLNLDGSNGEALGKQQGSNREAVNVQERKGKERKGKESINARASFSDSDLPGSGCEPKPAAQAEPEGPTYRDRLSPFKDSELVWLEFQREYPPPAGGNWGRAKGQLNYLLQQPKVFAVPIIDGAKRYRKFLEATESIGTQFVKSPDRWLIERLWEAPWTIPESRAPVGEVTQNWKEELRRSRLAKGA